MMIPRATPGGPVVTRSAGAWNALRQAASATQNTRGFRPGQSAPRQNRFRCLNASGAIIPRGGIVGIDRSRSLLDCAGEDDVPRVMAQPGVVGVTPTLTTHPGDHRLDWVIALQMISPDEVGDVCVTGMAWCRVKVHDAEHLYVGPVDGESGYGQTCSGGLGRIIQLCPDSTVDANGNRWALVLLDPITRIELEGYLETDLSRAVLSGGTMTDGTALVRIRERRSNQWVRINEFVRVRNCDEFATVPAGSFIAVKSWDSHGWRLEWISCSTSTAAGSSQVYAES